MAGRETGADKPTKVRGNRREFPFPVEAKLGPYPLPRQVSHLHHPVGIDHALSPPSILVLQVSQCVAGSLPTRVERTERRGWRGSARRASGGNPRAKSARR